MMLSEKVIVKLVSILNTLLWYVKFSFISILLLLFLLEMFWEPSIYVQIASANLKKSSYNNYLEKIRNRVTLWQV